MARTAQGVDAHGGSVHSVDVGEVLGDDAVLGDAHQEAQILQRGALADHDEVDDAVGHVRKGRQAGIGAVGAAGHDDRHDRIELPLDRLPRPCFEVSLIW